MKRLKAIAVFVAAIFAASIAVLARQPAAVTGVVKKDTVGG